MTKRFKHGTCSSYVSRACHCAVCKAAKATYDTRRRATPAYRAANVAYEATPARQAAMARHKAAYNAKYYATPEGARKHKSRNTLNNAIRAGKLIRLASCPICGGSGRIHGHHIDYSQPFTVLWRCTPCHKFLHKALAGKLIRA